MNPVGGGGGGVLGLSCDGDDRRIFLSLKFLILRIFGVGKFGKYNKEILSTIKELFLGV